MRRLVTVVAVGGVVLALSAAPAWADSSFTAGAEAEANTEQHPLELTLTEPEKEDYGDTAKVTVVAADGFTVDGCQPEPLRWDCTYEGRTVTFTRAELGALADATLEFSVTTPGFNGDYTFSVTQADGAEEPATARSLPTVTVVGGEDPPAQDDDGTTDSGSTDGNDTTDDSAGTNTTSDDQDDGSDSAGEDDPETGDQQETSDDSDSGGSTTPRRSEGRSAGTTLEVTPGESGDEDAASSDVADDPAVAPPADAGDEQDTGAAAVTTIEEGQPPAPEDGGGRPWQQPVGALLLVAGGAVIALRRWDVVGLVRDGDLGERVRSWRTNAWDRLRS